jgi:Leucine-rich repeat (LRR) protein
LEIIINNNFNKPTLLRVYYDGDYNGTSIDFKTDETYIFDNSAIGLSSYFYGTYKINGNKITMDKDTIDNLTNLKYLEIRDKQIEEMESGMYLYQVDSSGNLIKHSDKYRVIIDNRKEALQCRTTSR